MLKCIKRGQSPVAAVPLDDLSAYEYGGQVPDALIINRRQEEELPVTLSVKYRDFALDYQDGEQKSSRYVTDSSIVKSIAFGGLVLDSWKAAQIAEVLQYLEWLTRNTFSCSTSISYIKYEPSDVITIESANGNNVYTARIIEREQQGSIINWSLEAEDPAIYKSFAYGSSGIFEEQVIPLITDTIVYFLDIPILLDINDNTGFYIAVNGGDNITYKGAIFYQSNDNGASWITSFAVTGLTVSGVATDILDPPPSNSTWVEDRGNTVNVELDVGELESINDENWRSLYNLVAIGVHGRWELICFRDATLEGDGSYTLSGLLRGLKGTDNNMDNHAIDDIILLIRQGSINRFDPGIDQLDIDRLYRAVSIGQTLDQGNDQTFKNTGIGLYPYSVVHITGDQDSSNDWIIDWVRRTRVGGASDWNLTVDVPLGESTEEYEVDIMDGASVARTISSLTTPTATYTAAQQITDFGSVQSSITVKIYQISAIVGRGIEREATL